MKISFRTATKMRPIRDPRDRITDHFVVATIGGVDFWTQVDSQASGSDLILKLTKELV